MLESEPWSVCQSCGSLGSQFASKPESVPSYRTGMRKLWPSRCCWTTTPVIPSHWPCMLGLKGVVFQQYLELLDCIIAVGLQMSGWILPQIKQSILLFIFLVYYVYIPTLPSSKGVQGSVHGSPFLHWIALRSTNEGQYTHTHTHNIFNQPQQTHKVGKAEIVAGPRLPSELHSWEAFEPQSQSNTLTTSRHKNNSWNLSNVQKNQQMSKLEASFEYEASGQIP